MTRPSLTRAGVSAAALAVLALLAAGCTSAVPVDPAPSARVTATSSPTLPATLGFSPGYRVLGLQEAELSRQLAADVEAGARWWRVDVDWSVVEPSPGVEDWSVPERVIAAARARGLEVVALLGYAPEHARAADGTPDAAAFARFAARAAQRFAPAGVHAWEIWNEPNLRSAWGAEPDPVGYGRLLRAAAPAIMAADPAGTVVSGGLAPVPDRSGSSLSIGTFLEGVAADGPVPGLAAVAVHAYVFPQLPDEAPASATNPFSLLEAVHGIAERLGAAGGPVWTTESGAPTGLAPRAVTPAAQALTLEQAHRRLAALPWAGPLLVYSDRDSGEDPFDREANFGLLDLGFGPKPAWEVFDRLAAGG